MTGADGAVGCHLRTKTVAPDELQPLWGSMLGEIGEEIEGVKHAKVLLKALRVRGVEHDAAFERLIADLLKLAEGAALCTQ